MTERKPFNVIFTCLQPSEGRIVVDAESQEHAKTLATAILATKVQEVVIVDVYPYTQDPSMDFIKNDINQRIN